MDTGKPEPKMLYQVWKGSNRFFFGGRLVFGPDVASLFLSILLIIGPATAFCVKIFFITRQWLRENKNVVPWYAVLLVAIVLIMLDVLFLLLTSSRDPGIVPRNSKPPECDETVDLNAPSMEWVTGRTPHVKLPRTRDIIVNEHVVKVKYCDTCLLYRPPRASHCSICNNCIQRFDHHCPWVGQCIGVFPITQLFLHVQRNYRFFYMFVSTSTLLCAFIFGVSWYNIITRKGTVLKAISSDYLSDFLILYCFITIWFVGGLSVFHFYLISTNQTTYENYRYRYDKKENPYNRGMISNFKEIFLSSIPPSMNDFRAIVKEDEAMVMEPTNQNLMGGVTSPKDKIDIEMGSNSVDNKGSVTPDILRNIECDDIEDNAKQKEVSERSDSSPVEQNLTGLTSSSAITEVNPEDKCDATISE